MAKKSSETLEEGLERSARKKGYTGKERQRYVGGAIRNMEKRGAIGTIKPSTSRIMHHSATHTVRTAAKHVEPRKAPAPARKAYSSPTITKRAHVTLEAKKRQDHYVIVNAKTGETWNSSRFKKLASARNEAKIEQDAYNAGLTRGRL